MTLRRPGDQAVIGAERQRRRRDLTGQDAHPRAVHDFTFPRDAFGRVRPHLGDGDGQPEFVAQFDPVQQQDVVDERAHRVLACHRRHAQNLRILVIVDRRDLVLFHERNQRVEEIAKDSHRRSERRSVRG